MARFVVCVKNEGYEAALELRKLYELLPAESAAKLSMVRVLDESGEDYLYPDTFFVPISLPQGVEERVVLAAC